MADAPAVAAFVISDPPTANGSLSTTTIGRALRSTWNDRRARMALSFLAIVVLAALTAPWLAPFDPLRTLDPAARAIGPNATHWFGTDHSTRDVLSRMLFGARVSLAIAALSAFIGSGVGLLYGATAGFAGGRLDGFMMRTVDALLAIPRILLLLTVIALWPSVSAWSLIAVLGFTGWFEVARLARTEAASLRAREFVVAARALGASPARIFVRHVLPHASAPVLVATTIAIGQVIILEAGLSYLGYGIQAPAPTWGNIIRDGRETIASTWWLTLFPGLALISVAWAVNTLADRLRRALNPRQLPAP